jgi:hypothetical protein
VKAERLEGVAVTQAEWLLTAGDRVGLADVLQPRVLV